MFFESIKQLFLSIYFLQNTQITKQFCIHYYNKDINLNLSIFADNFYAMYGNKYKCINYYLCSKMCSY